MEERAKTRIHKSLIFVETSRFQVQKDSLKDYRKEKLTPTGIRNNKMYLTELSHIRKLKELRKLRRMSCCLKNYAKKTVVLTPQRP